MTHLAASLNGRTVAFVEARMRSEMAGLIQRHGGVPYPAPVLQEIYLKGSPEVRQLVEDVCDRKLHVMVLLTGVGTRALIEAAAALEREQEFLQSLDAVTVIARSPKPARVLRQHNIHIDLMPPEPYTSEVLLEAIHDMDLQDKDVAVQAYGGPNSLLIKGLQQKGANVREVTLYTWGLPEDVAPVLEMVDDLAAGNIDAVIFTSQPQIDNLLSIAEEAGKEGALRESLARDSVVVASIGPVCSRKLREKGVKVDVEPEHVHMGNLIIALAEHFEQGRVAVP